MKPTLIDTLSPVPRPRRWGRDAICVVIAALLLASLFCSCQSSPKKPQHEAGPDYPYPHDRQIDPVTTEPPNVILPPKK